MTEPTETIELDDIPAEVPDRPEPTFHTLLEVWRAVLGPAREALRSDPITPQWAVRMVNTYPQVTFRDTPAINTMFLVIVGELSQILDEEIASDDQCLKWGSAEEDRENNSQHYKDLLTDWQVHMLRRELEWDPRDEDAAVMLAAMSEVHNMFFGEKGLVAHLESIKFEFTEDDQEELGQALVAARADFYKGGEDE
jgi:hypothetical protein